MDKDVSVSLGGVTKDYVRPRDMGQFYVNCGGEQERVPLHPRAFPLERDGDRYDIVLTYDGETLDMECQRTQVKSRRISSKKFSCDDSVSMNIADYTKRQKLLAALCGLAVLRERA